MKRVFEFNGFYVVEYGNVFRVHTGYNSPHVGFVITPWSSFKKARKDCVSLGMGLRSPKKFSDGYRGYIERLLNGMGL